MALVLTGTVASVTAATRVNTTLTTSGGAAANGTLLIAALYWESHISITAPSGWVQIGTVASTSQIFDIAVWYKLAGAGEPTTYTWTHASTWTQGSLQVITGAPTSSPLDGTATTNQSVASGTTATGLTLTTAQANSALFLFVAHWTASRTLASWTAPLTERLDTTQFGFASGVQAAAGASGNKTATISVSDDWATVMFAVLDASVTPAVGLPLLPRSMHEMTYLRM